MMKKLIVLMVAGLFTFSVTSKSQASVTAAITAAQMLSKFYKTLKDPNTIKNICSKGDLLTGTITIRSFDGSLCSFKPIAALAKKYCMNPQNNYPNDPFVGSKCEKNINKLGPKNPLEIAGSLPKSQKNDFCMNIKNEGTTEDNKYWKVICD